MAEPIVAPYGTAGDQILVQLPGVTDVARAKEHHPRDGAARIKIVEDGPAPTRRRCSSAAAAWCRRTWKSITGADPSTPGATGRTTW